MTPLSAHSGRDFAQGEVLHESPGRLIEGQPECIMDDVFATTQILWEDEAAMTQTGGYIYIYMGYIYICIYIYMGYIYGMYIYIYGIYIWDVYIYMGYIYIYMGYIYMGYLYIYISHMGYIYKWDIYGYMGKNGRRGKLGQDRL